jgi:pyruvate dehydrogenase E2 component (dihydrolipoamide acetyltransferase)
MPKLSDIMEEGTVLEWKKQDGTEVKKGDVLAEIESDKASFEIEAEADGVLNIVVEKGKPVPVGDLIATIGGEKPAAKKEAPKEEPKAEAPKDAPQEGPKAEAKPAEEPKPKAAEKQDGATPSGSESRLKASPIAARLAAEMGVDLRSLKGSGPEGRIVKEDVLAAAEKGGQAPAARREAPAPRTGPEVEIEEPTRMQATIARRMVASKTQVPHFYITVEARVDEAMRMRQQLKETVPGAEKVTLTDFLTRAVAIALTRFPELNASWVDGHFERKRSINIGLAVAPASGLGLLVPVVHDCDRKDLVQISIEARQVIERARSGKPSEGDLSGGTFSISNLGMYGVDEFAAIINQPEAAILAVGAAKEAAVVENGRVVVGRVMRMTLSVDHRVFYGAPAAQFMAEVRRLLENPVALVVPPEA